MNETAAAVGNTSSSVVADATSTFTTMHLALIGVLALLVIAGIVYGAILKHRRHAAERAVEVHAQEAGVAPVPPPSPEALAPEPFASEPLAPETTLPPPPPESAAFAAAPPPPAAPAPAPVTLVPSPIADMPALATAPEALADEPIAAVAPLEASPASAASAPSGSASAADGPVTQLKGLGPKVAARLAELGITTVGQIAALDENAATSLDAQLGTFRGRMGRDRWIEQARFLAAGDRAGFEAVFGRL